MPYNSENGKTSFSKEFQLSDNIRQGTRGESQFNPEFFWRILTAINHQLAWAVT